MRRKPLINRSSVWADFVNMFALRRVARDSAVTKAQDLDERGQLSRKPPWKSPSEWAAFAAGRTYQASHDDVTGLPTRGYVVDRVQEVIARSIDRQLSVTVMLIDMGDARSFDPSLSGTEWNKVLQTASQRLTKAIGTDGLVGRSFANEFVVATSGRTEREARQDAESLLRVLVSAYPIDGGELEIPIAIGVAHADQGEGHDSVANLLKDAELARRRSTDRGGSIVTVFGPELKARVARRTSLEQRLERALKDGGFGPWFQPIVSLPSGRIAGFEALARWIEDGQVVSPAEFIPVAEESGQIVSLGEFVIEEACKQLVWWRTSIPNFSKLWISVNVSPRQLRHPDFADTIESILHRLGLPGEVLSLEVTESALMEDSLAVAGAMASLRSLGVRLLVDDFGTGFSSLSYLKLFPINAVKIDRSFVLGLGRHESDSSLVAAIVAMASALDMESIAEGVETRDQAQRLFALGCRQAQGYLFGQAVTATEVPEVVERLGISGAPDATTRTDRPLRRQTS